MTQPTFTIFPALHIRDGKTTRFGTVDTISAAYDEDPVTCAQNWIDQGAQWIQLVNLDAAFDKEAPHNWELVKQICQLDVKVQFGGGIRSIADVDWAIDSGIERVIIGTAAVENPQMMAQAVSKYGNQQIILAIDSDQAGGVRTHGRQTAGAFGAISLGRQMRQLGVKTAVYTNVNRDGSMSGVDWQTAATLANDTGLEIIAGGGVSDYDDIIACYHQEGISGIVVGRALYANKINLKKAVDSLKLKLSFDSGVPNWKTSQQTPWGRLRYKIAENNLQTHLPSKTGLHILDAGGGNGMDAIPLARQGHHVTLLDPSQAMLNDAGVMADENQVVNNMAFQLAEVMHIPHIYPDATFDVVLSHNVLQFVDDPTRFVNDLAHVMKPDGVLSLISVNRYALPYRAAFLDGNIEQAIEMLDEREQVSTTFHSPMHHYAGDEVITMLENVGLTVEAHYGIRCLYDYWGDNERKGEKKTAVALETLEMALTNRHPYKLLARFFQIIARK